MKLFIFALLIALASAKVRYDGYQVLRVEPWDDTQLKFFEELELEGKVSFWTQPLTTKRPTDIMVQPRFQDDFKEILDAKQIKYSVMMQDVQAVIDSQSRPDDYVPSSTFDYSDYHTYEEINQWVRDITDEYNSATREIITSSWYGREVPVIKICVHGCGNKQAVYWQGGLHAREWISPATVMYMTKQLLADYGSDREVTDILDNFDFYIVPLLNPDGYAYSWTDDRMWRKTRSDSGKTCIGVDPNRNYDYAWGGAGASDKPCSSTYRGPSAFSEPEVTGSINFLLSQAVSQKFVSFIDFHSYSQLWLYPWSYTDATLPDDTGNHEAAAAEIVKAIKGATGATYNHGPSGQSLYLASGVSIDWAYGVLGAKYSYVVELRDEGQTGFLLPNDQIIPTGEETYAAIKALYMHILSP